ncbi:hypothetical protein SNK05_005434 [Fusarium graminearum]
MAIAKFGRRVINCSDKYAEKNNKLAIGMFSYDEPGEVYKTSWGSHQYAVVILPRTGSLSQAGFQETNISIKDTPLVKDLRDTPRCYEYETASGVLEWAESY